MFLSPEFIHKVFYEGKYKDIQVVFTELNSLDKDIYEIYHKKYYPTEEGFSNNKNYYYDIITILDKEENESHIFGRLNFCLFGEWITIDEFFSSMNSENVERESFQTEGFIQHNQHSKLNKEIIDSIRDIIPQEKYLSVDEYNLSRIEKIINYFQENYSLMVNYLGKKKVYKGGQVMNGIESYVEVFEILGSNKKGEFPLYVGQEYVWNSEEKNYEKIDTFKYIKKVVEHAVKYTSKQQINPL